MVDTNKTLFQQTSELMKSAGRTDGVKTVIGQRYGGRDASLGLPGISTALGAVYRQMSQLSSRISDVYSHISEVVENRIIKGLDVTASNPANMYVSISKGEGSVNGYLVKLVRDTKVAIPSDSNVYSWYINFHDNVITVDTQRFDYKLCLGNVIIPRPGVTTSIADDRVIGDWNGYIISGKDFLFAKDYEIDERSLDAIRDSMRKIFAENIFGTITLSERLSVVNREGSMSLSATDLKFFYPDGGLGSKFNKRGTYFYDDNGKELAVFTADHARVGNIKIYPTYLQLGDSNTHIKLDAANDRIYSNNFVSGWLGAGWQIDKTGSAEFQNIFARGRIATSVFEKNTISVMGGNFLVLDGAVLDADMSTSSTTFTVKGDTTFVSGDIVRVKDGVDDEFMEITGVVTGVYTVTRDKLGTYSGTPPAWTEGTAVTNFKQSGDGGVYMTASESNAPYLSIFTHTGTPWTGLTTHVRLGNLNGFLGYATDKYGIAIGTTNDYLKYDPTNGLLIKGSITVTGGDAFSKTTDDLDAVNDGSSYVRVVPNEKTGAGYAYTGFDSNSSLVTKVLPGANVGTPGGAGLFLGADYLGYYSGSAWTAYIQSNGNFYFGDGSTKYVSWNGSNLDVRGRLNADDIYTGTLNAGIVTISSTDGYMTLTGNLLTITDSAPVAQVKLGNYTGSSYGLWAGAGNVILDEDGIVINDGGAASSSMLQMKVASGIRFFNANDVYVGTIYASGAETYLRIGTFSGWGIYADNYTLPLATVDRGIYWGTVASWNLMIRRDSIGTRMEIDAGSALVPYTDNAITLGDGTRDWQRLYTHSIVMNDGPLSQASYLEIKDGITAPGNVAGYGRIYIDTADGSLKIVFGGGTVKTITTDP